MLKAGTKLIFTSPSKGDLDIAGLVEEIVTFFKEDPNVNYTLVIGSDSQVKHENGAQEVDFVSAIVIHRTGKGGRYFYRKIKDQNLK